MSEAERLCPLAGGFEEEEDVELDEEVGSRAGEETEVAGSSADAPCGKAGDGAWMWIEGSMLDCCVVGAT